MRLARTGQVSPLHSPVRAVPKPRHHALTPPLAGSSGLGFQSQLRRGTRLVEGPQTAVKASTAAVQSQWWIENAELWVEIESEEQFQREVSDPSCELVVVDFYAAWCNGCKSVYPKLCLLAGDTELRKKVKFVKLNVDKLKSLMRKQGVKALPCVKLFRPSTGPVVQFQATLSRAKHFKHNVEVVLENPDKYFVADPNGFVTPTDTPPTSASEELRKRREAAALQAQSGKLYEKLLQVSTTPGGSAYAGRMARNKFSDYTSADHSIALAKEMFLRQNRDDYGYGGRIDALYAAEIAPRMEPNEHYLDYTGSSLYCNSQLEAALTELKSNVFGNPHSANPSSQLTEERIEDARERVLRFFNADPSQYHVVFTRSATASLKIVGETFPWEKTSSFRYLRENHNSVLGVRAYALNHGATFEAVDELWMESWITGNPPPALPSCLSVILR